MAQGTAPVKYLVGILTSKEEARTDVLKELTKYFGDPDYISKWYTFDHTNFYAPEMGANLKRSFVSFDRLQPPELIYKAKIWASEVEDMFRENDQRIINIDPGYIDYFKIILASGKFGGHKIAVTKGCWADFLMMYNKGSWDPMPWCFPDFASGMYNADLTEMRRLFKVARQNMGS